MLLIGLLILIAQGFVTQINELQSLFERGGIGYLTVFIIGRAGQNLAGALAEGLHVGTGIQKVQPLGFGES